MDEKVDYDAKVLLSEEQGHGSGIYHLELAVPDSFISQARPGMYCSFTPRDKTHQHRRPFSIVDAKDNKLVFLIKNVGPNTSYYTSRKSDEIINITNPRGQGIFIDSEIDHYILVAGSIGAAPLAFLAKNLRELDKEVTVLLGAKNILQIAGAKFFYNHGCEVKIIAEAGKGVKNIGFVTDLLFEEFFFLDGQASVVTCGPIPMMKAVAKMCEPQEVSCQLILENVFACNMGACLGCAVFMRDGTTKHICKDGPAFLANKLDLDRLVDAHLSPQDLERIPFCDLSVILKGQEGRILELKYPTMGASGCQSESSLLNEYIDTSYMGAIIAKGLSLYPSFGNPPPRVCETPSGMLNAIGLENVGLESFLKYKLPALFEHDIPVIPNIHGKSTEEYVELSSALDKTDVAGIELNFSCPNVKGGMSISLDKDLMYDAVHEVRKITNKFLIVKLSPNVTNHVPIAEAAAEAGADAISLTNTLLGMSIDIHSRRPKLRNIIGGLSGPAIYPVALGKVYQLYVANIGIPIIGVGGINGSDKAIQFLIGGALAVQIGTAGFNNSKVFTETVQGIEEYMLANGFASTPELSGSLLID